MRKLLIFESKNYFSKDFSYKYEENKLIENIISWNCKLFLIFLN
jgi:hypothetical protein